MLATAMDQSPMNAAYPRLGAEFELRQPSPDVARVVEQFGRVTALDPNDISARLDYARSLERFAHYREARKQYEEAIRLNDLMDPAEPERLRPHTLAQIRERIQSIPR